MCSARRWGTSRKFYERSWVAHDLTKSVDNQNCHQNGPEQATAFKFGPDAAAKITKTALKCLFEDELSTLPDTQPRLVGFPTVVQGGILVFSSKLLASKSTRVVACFVFLAVSFSATIPLQAQTPHAAAWGKLSPATPFPTRTAFASAYDPVSKKIVIFGGTDEVDQFSDTWTFDGSTWTQVDTSVSPGPR